MPSPVYQYVINLVVNLPFRRGSSTLMNVSVIEHRALNKFFMCQRLLFSHHYHCYPYADSHSHLLVWKYSLSLIAL